MSVDLSIIIVSWNVWDLLRACLYSIEQASRAVDSSGVNGVSNDIRLFGPTSLGKQAPTLEVIVVDNASSDATVELLPARFPWVRLIRSATNLGFTAGNNVGYATSRGQALYFLNPDTELVDTLHQANRPTTNAHAPDGGDSLWILYQALMANPRLALVGPQLRFPDNTLQNSRYHFQYPLTTFFESGTLGRYWHNNPWYRHLHVLDWPASFPQEVDCVVGAAMLVRRQALEQVRQPDTIGPFDEGFFMYSEEVDLCNRLKRAGWGIAYFPDAAVIHYEGQSSIQVVAERDIYYFQSKIRYHEKYFGATWAAFLRFMFLLNFRFQLLIEASKWLLGNKRPMRAQRIKAYRQVLASRLRPRSKAPPVQTVNASVK